eukprot:scaffold112_cov282-Prasinococcus_capsulatus_cf.AAC.19
MSTQRAASRNAGTIYVRRPQLSRRPTVSDERGRCTQPGLLHLLYKSPQPELVILAYTSTRAAYTRMRAAGTSRAGILPRTRNAGRPADRSVASTAAHRSRSPPRPSSSSSSARRAVAIAAVAASPPPRSSSASAPSAPFPLWTGSAVPRTLTLTLSLPPGCPSGAQATSVSCMPPMGAQKEDSFSYQKQSDSS